MKVFFIFPHQLFELKYYPSLDFQFVLVDHFKTSCKNKIRLHRASVIYYIELLKSKKCNILFLESIDELVRFKKDEVIMFDPVEKDIKSALKKMRISVNYLDTPYFICNSSELSEFSGKTQESFYRWQRKRLDILMNGSKPMGGKFNFDKSNRGILKGNPPNHKISKNIDSKYYEKADKHLKYTKYNYGEIANFNYPCTHKSAKQWLNRFLKIKLNSFGEIQDYVHDEDDILNHSLLSPMMNIGLLTPIYVIKITMKYYDNNENINLSSLEGFIRQIIGWREYMRYIYEYSAININMNHFGNKNKLKKSFYNGTTGFEPIDHHIKYALKNGYSHHIVRLMWLGSFFLLCQINPKLVYKWFMELYIDAYDWVMIPNVIGMSQYADGGIVATRPYFSSSNYLKKMSNFKADWSIWDSLYYKFIDDKSPQLKKLYIVSNWVGHWNKKTSEEKTKLLKDANLFLDSLA